MISVITPTHNPQWLIEAAESLRAQTYQGPWEWIVVPNGGAMIAEDHEARRDPRSRIIPYPSDAPQTIGAIKRFCCQHAQSDMIVELDHDDMLAPTALDRLAEALDRSQFVYSNFAEFVDGSWEPGIYNQAYGWRYRERDCYGHSFQEARGFPPTAQSLASINFAPNHVRAWRGDAYWRIGGHNPEMLVADDHDLCCRFYLDGEMEHIDDLLYLYRLHGSNSYKVMNADVQAAACAVRDRYLHRLVARWAELNNLLKIDICSGADPPEGYIGADWSRRADRVEAVDLNNTWPWPDSSVGVVRAVDALEHLRDPMHTMQEIYRVLAPGAWLLSMTPSTDGRGAFQDPTHVSWWNQNSFHYWTRAQFQQYLPPIATGSRARFQPVRLETMFPSDWHRANQIPYVRADLVALKDGYRGPGLVEV